MSKHEWRENMDDGDVRFFTATRHGRKWKFRTKLKSDDEWTSHDVLPAEDLESLLEILWNKHQRRRVPHEHVVEIEEMIRAAERG